MSLFTGGILLASALAAAGTKGAFDAAGASKTANASKHGADLQAQGADRAETFLEGQKAKQEAAWAPYQQVSQQAVGMLPSLARQAPQMGAPAPYTTQPRATMPMQGAGTPLSGMGQPMPAVAAQSGGTVAGGQTQPMVLLQAPDGSKKSVPQTQAQFYVSKGAKVIG